MAGRKGAAATVLPRQSEKEFQAAVLELAGLLGWRCWHDRATNVPHRCKSCGAWQRILRNAPGLPDLILVRRPRLIFAELKAEDGKTTQDQLDWLNALSGSGSVETYLWRPSSWTEIERLLK